MANIKNAVKLGVFTMAIMNVGSSIICVGLPAEAVCGMSSASTIFSGDCLPYPDTLVAARLAAMFQDKQGGMFRWVGEAYGKKKPGFLAIWVQWIESTIWYPTRIDIRCRIHRLHRNERRTDISLANNKYYTSS